MTFKNPTPVQIGMAGTFYGKQYRVLGRVFLGESEEGGTYYWHEFNLETESRESATLVYEVMERGPEWRWITMFEPARGLSAEDAATKRVGDTLDLDGTNVRVTLVRRSRIYHVEGTAPEGEPVRG